MKTSILIISFMAISSVALCLEPGKFLFSATANKVGVEKPYESSLECALSISNQIVFISGLETGQPIHFRGALTNDMIEFETLFPSNSVIAGMDMSNRYTGNVISAQEASGRLIGTAGTNVYLRGFWTLKKIDKN